MNTSTVILIAEDDKGHFELVKRNLWLTCFDNEILHFKDGQEVLDFLFKANCPPHRENNKSYILLLDIRMPKVDGREVLRQIKQDSELRKIPVVMLTTTNDQSEIDTCYDLGCSFYMVKPADYRRFMESVTSLGAYLSLAGVRVPAIDE